MEFITKSAKETKDLGKKIGVDLVSSNSSGVAELTPPRWKKEGGAVVLALTGDLGSGKTTFVQGLAKGLGIKQRIISPTFILMRQYRIKLKTQNSHQKGGQAKLKNFYHVDLYRLEDSLEKEIENLGLKEIWSDPGNIVVIEWAEKAKDFIPDYVRWIEFEYVGKRKRKIVEGMKEM